MNVHVEPAEYDRLLGDAAMSERACELAAWARRFACRAHAGGGRMTDRPRIRATRGRQMSTPVPLTDPRRDRKGAFQSEVAG